MNHFLAFQNTYDELQIALMRDTHCVDERSVSKMHASALCIPTLQELLTSNNLTLESIPFIAVNQGPGPFTTLRVVITSVNGLSFATKIPLIGINGLQACIKQYENPAYPITVVLLNAFAQDLYFAIQSNQTIETGYNNHEQLFKELLHQFPDQPIRFLGNGTKLYEEKITILFGKHAIIPDPLPLHCAIEQIGKMGYEIWQRTKSGVTELMPLYLKKHAV